MGFVDPFIGAIKAKDHGRRIGKRRLASAAGPRVTLRNDLLPPFELVQMSLDDLRLGPRRLRKRDPTHIREVANAIAALGFSYPLLVRKDNLVLNGETAIEAARLIGLDRAPCELVILDAPIEIAGFTADDIDNVLQSEVGDGVERGALAPEPNAVAVACSGDLFRLGPHNLLCGDATDPLALRRAMRSDAPTEAEERAAALDRRRPRARMIFTDVPYNVPIRNNVTRGRHREFAMASGEMSPLEFLGFNESWMSAALPHLLDGGLLATFIDWRGLAIVEAAAAHLGLTPLSLVVWAKSNAGLGGFFRSQHELLPLYKRGDASHVNNVGLGKRGRWRSNLWTYPGASSLGSDARRGLADHPTVKPTAMLEDALLDLSNRGELVLDPFLGSGSTLIACHRTGRVCHGLEIDPLYVDVIVRRFEAESGEKARFAETGETFDDLAARRARAIAGANSTSNATTPFSGPAAEPSAEPRAPDATKTTKTPSPAARRRRRRSEG